MPLTQRLLQGLWLKALLFALFGYALLGKGFSYLYVGELILLLGIFVFFLTGRFMVVFSDSVLLLWGMFALWGLCRTLPFLSRYRFDAVRDAVVWGYGLFAVLIVAFVNTSHQISRALNTYRRFLKWYVPVLPVLLIISISFQDYVPKIPWSAQIGILSLEIGDAASSLAAAAVFWLLFPDRSFRSGEQGLSLSRVLSLAAWPIAAILLVNSTRAGFLAILIPILLVSVLKARTIGWKVAVFAVTSTIFALLIVEITLSGVQIKGRAITSDQVLAVASSAVGLENGAPSHQGTAEWRLLWWRHIIQYTFHGPYFWTGKGFGVNLAVDDDVPDVPGDNSLRSPHNGSMTVLARTGIPGLVLWVAINTTFAFRILKAYRRALRSGSRFWSSVNLWIFCYWLAIIINLSFDVVLENPHGGIWFWSIIGFGVASLRVQAHEARQLVGQLRIPGAEESYSTEHLLHA